MDALHDATLKGISNDNWGARARIGMFIVGSEAVPEAEWQAMAPQGVSVHAARVTAPTPWAAWRADHRSVDLADDLARGCRQFAAMKLSAIVTGQRPCGARYLRINASPCSNRPRITR